MNNRHANDPVLMNQNADLLVQIKKEGSRWNAYDLFGNKARKWVSTGQKQKAFEKNQALRRLFYKDGRPYWRMVPLSEFSLASDNAKRTTPFKPGVTAENLGSSDPVSYANDTTLVEVGGTYTPFLTHKDVLNYIQTSYSLKPKKVIVSELKWRHLIRTIVRGKNTMITGMQGCGKTLIARTAALVTNRPYFIFNLGEASDPRSYLLGNTHFNKETGTVFYPSRFIRAIQTRGAIIHLDELSRAHPETWNVLMSALDYTQRYVILDESKDSATINVAEGVTFLATANIGSEFTATRVLDRALTDRFTFVEMDILTVEQETELLQLLYPSLDNALLAAIADVSTTTRAEYASTAAKLTTSVSTRLSVEWASLLYDGFTFADAAELTVYPFFSADGGIDSERTFIKQLVQRYVDDGTGVPFGPDDVSKAPAVN